MTIAIMQSLSQRWCADVLTCSSTLDLISIKQRPSLCHAAHSESSPARTFIETAQEPPDENLPDTESQQWTVRAGIKHKTSNPSFWIKMLIWAVLSAEVDCLCLMKPDGANRQRLMFLGHWSLPLPSLTDRVASCWFARDKSGFQSSQILLLCEKNSLSKTAGSNFVILGHSYLAQIAILPHLRASLQRLFWLRKIGTTAQVQVLPWKKSKCNNLGYIKFTDPSIFNTCFVLHSGLWGSAGALKAFKGRRQGTLWTSHQFIAGLHRDKKNNLLSHTPLVNFWVSNSPHTYVYGLSEGAGEHGEN